MRSVMFVAAAALFLPAAVWADETPVSETQPSAVGHGYDTMAQVCNLTAEQQSRIAALDAEMVKSVAAFKAANADAIAAAKAALKTAQNSNDEAGIARAKADMATLFAPMAATTQKFMDDIMAVLTAEQKAKWNKYITLMAIRGIFDVARLTDAQMDQVRAAYDNFFQQDSTVTPAIMLTKLATVVQGILTQEQKDMLKKWSKVVPAVAKPS